MKLKVSPETFDKHGVLAFERPDGRISILVPADLELKELSGEDVKIGVNLESEQENPSIWELLKGVP